MMNDVRRGAPHALGRALGKDSEVVVTVPPLRRALAVLPNGAAD